MKLKNCLYCGMSVESHDELFIKVECETIFKKLIEHLNRQVPDEEEEKRDVTEQPPNCS